MGDESFWADVNRQRHIAFGSTRGISDQDIAREHRAQAIFFPALTQFQARIRDAATLSALMAEDFRRTLPAFVLN